MSTKWPLLLLLLPALANADCYCTCINGKNQPICESSMDLRPICGPEV